MPRPLKNERYAGAYFSWVLSTRDGVWWADGRSNAINAGRHSLGTKDRAEAVLNLPRLDLTAAVEKGLAEPELLEPIHGEKLSIAAGREIYEKHVARSRITGGTRKSSQKRYRAVLDKLVGYLAMKGVTEWNRVNASTLKNYLNHLDKEGYAYGTQYLEGTTVKQIINHFVAEKLLPAEAKITLKLPKPRGTNTYCWRPGEVIAIREFTCANPELRWLYDLLTTLTFTGLRIGEVIALRWSDIDFDAGMINLVDESTSRRRHERAIRTLKGGRDRSFPINPELRPLLESISRKPDGFVFHGPRGGRLKADTVRNILIRDVLKPLAKKFPTPEGENGFADGRLHSFRHFFCSLCANRQVPQQVVMKWLGHQDSKLVAHYYHLHDDEARRQMMKIKLDPGALEFEVEKK
ncbi:hypothetical protein BH11PLA2_BH11PLA2_30930 [soil metagenome]